jgi:hypothetical protein
MTDTFEARPPVESVHVSTPEPTVDVSSDGGEGAEDGESGKSPARERSSIQFPYGDLDDAIRIAEAVYQYGLSADVDQVAANLGQTTSSSAFRTKLATARTFGVVEGGRRSISLTELGGQLVDPDRRSSGLVDAFMHVPLYVRLYELFQGRRLPGENGLEEEMKRLGVSPKQAPRARQAFQRSADTAGLYLSGKDRLVVPPRGNGQAGKNLPPAEDAPPPPPPKSMAQHPLVLGLINLLPPEDQRFTAKQRARWLNAAQVNLDLIYGDDDEGE